uniref:F-box domain-containing protein n=1 Tax=Leptobrachium leishanense TaxID=445787 RepID=A0A8C5QH30_9ANUR
MEASAEGYSGRSAEVNKPLLRQCEKARARSCSGEKSTPPRGLLHLSDELLLMLMDYLDPYSLLNVGVTCHVMYRICLTDSLWAKHCAVAFGSEFRSSDASYTPKEAFKLLCIWKTLYQTLTFNRPLQDILYSTIPPKRYWCRWLTLETFVTLPLVQLASNDIEDIWGIGKDLLDEKHKVIEDESIEVREQSLFKYDWKELHNLAMAHHGSISKLQEFQLQKMSSDCHGELECIFTKYMANKFKWAFSYWLFGFPKQSARHLRKIYLWWKTYNKRKVFPWGNALCDLEYIASLHFITLDYWNGKLANGEEATGIGTVNNYFSMSRSLLAWILGRKWSRYKQKKIYRETLDGVYRALKSEMQSSLITHVKFWTTAKLLLSRICTLEETAGNYVNWKLISVLPSYKLYMATEDPVHLQQIKSTLARKRRISNWLKRDLNAWARDLLPDCLYRVLEYETTICEARKTNHPVRRLFKDLMNTSAIDMFSI